MTIMELFYSYLFPIQLNSVLIKAILLINLSDMERTNRFLLQDMDKVIRQFNIVTFLPHHGLFPDRGSGPS